LGFNVVQGHVLVYPESSSSLEMCVAPSNREKNSLKTPILGFKVVQGHRCWYSQKAREQCLLW